MDLKDFVKELRDIASFFEYMNEHSPTSSQLPPHFARYIDVAADLLELHNNRVVDMDAAIKLLEQVLLHSADRAHNYRPLHLVKEKKD